MPKFIDLTGQRFENLLIVSHEGRNHTGKHIYRCKCSCGNMVTLRGEDIKSGNTKSCGCLRRQMTIEKNYKHGLAKTPIHSVWRCVKDRILNPNNKSFKNYGGRGLTISKSWESFTNFHDDMASTYKTGLTLERVDNNKGYCKENCIWADRITQANNTRKNTFITYEGETLTVSQLARKHKLPQAVLCKRLSNGWDIEKSLTTPVLKNTEYIIDGISETLPKIAKRYNLKYDSLRYYVNKGNSIEDSIKIATKI